MHKRYKHYPPCHNKKPPATHHTAHHTAHTTQSNSYHTLRTHPTNKRAAHLPARASKREGVSSVPPFIPSSTRWLRTTNTPRRVLHATPTRSGTPSGNSINSTSGGGSPSEAAAAAAAFLVAAPAGPQARPPPFFGGRPRLRGPSSSTPRDSHTSADAPNSPQRPDAAAAAAAAAVLSMVGIQKPETVVDPVPVPWLMRWTFARGVARAHPPGASGMGAAGLLHLKG